MSVRVPKDVKVGYRIFIFRGDTVVAGEGVIEILEAIDSVGSLSGAAEMLNINYRRLWNRLSLAERRLGFRLVERHKGRGGTHLTPEGKLLVMEFRRLAGVLRECTGGNT